MTDNTITLPKANDVLHLPGVPDSVRDRILNLRDLVADRRVALIRSSDDRNNASTAKAKAEERLREVERAGKFLDLKAPPVPQLVEEIARETATMRRYSARVEELEPSYQRAAQLLRNLEGYISANAARLVPYAGAAPRLLDGESALDALERAARRVRTLRADRDQVRASPFPSALAKQAARAELKGRIEQARPDAGELVDKLGPIHWPTAPIDIIGGSPTNPVDARAIDVIGTLAWLFEKQFLAALDAEIDLVSDDEHALSTPQRIEKLKIIDGDLLDAARHECAYSEMANVLPRSDVDPRAFLQLDASAPAPERND